MRPSRYPLTIVFDAASRLGKRLSRDEAERLLARSGFLSWGVPFSDETLDRLDSAVSALLMGTFDFRDHNPNPEP